MDDIRNPEDCFKYTQQPAYLMDNWDVVRNYDEFIKDTLNNGVAVGYSFDHDLADEHYGTQENIEYGLNNCSRKSKKN